VPGTPASQSGIQSGDTVMRIDSREIYRPSDVLDASFFSHVGGTMTVVVRRDDKLYDYSFAVIEHTINPGSTPQPITNGPGLVSGPSSKPTETGEPIQVNHVVNGSQ
jgi:C-terminal processing protease CtpA/Prc